MNEDEAARKLAQQEEAVAARPVTVFAFAQGLKRTLPAGSRVRVVERRPNGTVVVVTDDGYLGHVSSKEAEALSARPAAPEPGPAPSPEARPAGAPAVEAAPGLPPIEEKQLWERLRSVYDPEIPVNVVDLGLIYALRIKGHAVEIDMTLTAPGCPVGDEIRDEIETKLLHVPGVEDVKVDFVWEPPWSREKISDAAKLQLGML